MKHFYVIVDDCNAKKMVPYDIIPYLVEQYKKKDKTLTSFEDFKEFIRAESMYQWWSRCQYEIILTDWPCRSYSEKWDVHRQVEMNLDVITEIFMDEINS